MSGRERCVMILYLRGFKKVELNKVYFGTDADKAKRKEVISKGDQPIDAMDVVKIQLDYLLKTYGNDLLNSNKVIKCTRQDD